MSAVVLVGLASGSGSWALQESDPWWSATLSNVAVVALLLAPGEFALSWITSGFDRLERVTDEVRTTAERAQGTAERAERSLEDVRQVLLERQHAEHQSELDVYRDIVRDPSCTSLVRALRHASDTEMLATAGVRVPVWETDLHYRFVLGAHEHLKVRLELDNGRVLSTHTWDPAAPAEGFYQTLVQAVRAAGRDLGVGLNDPTQSVQELSEMLIEVARLRSQELLGYRQHLRKIVERRDGWYFTEEHVIPADNLHYGIAVSRLNEMDWEEHLLGKGWYGAGAALQFARELYGASG